MVISMRILKQVALASLIGLALVAAPRPSSADVFNFTACAVTGGCNGGSSPFGTVTTTFDNGTNKTTVAISLNGTYNLFGSGNDPVVIAFNVTGGPTLTVDTSTGVGKLPAAGGTWTYTAGATPNGNPPSGSIGGMNEYFTTSTHNVILGQLAT